MDWFTLMQIAKSDSRLMELVLVTLPPSPLRSAAEEMIVVDRCVASIQVIWISICFRFVVQLF
jgi:hypothetical protein